ncbi:hypothetical protein RHOSPDRAFT_32567 [Rhodotorula sp. JG-1b]|nr:hypothetical protein RHOSPDRAFT_32567 [Rhodotorula sp. JG-1b]
MSPTAAAELPSLFAAVQQPLAHPRIDLHARQLSSADRKQHDHLVQVAERGPAAHFLHSVLDQSYRQTIHSWSRSRTRTHTDGDDDDDDDDLELRERGYVHKPRRSKRRSRRSHSVAASAEGDDEGDGDDGGQDGDETELEATTHTRSRRDKVQRTRRRVKKLKQSLRIPEIDLERPDLPPDFPPSGLFTALHARTSHLYEARHNLLAPLTLAPTPTTTSSATLPEPVRAHFDALRTRLNAEEERAVRGGTRDVVTAWKRTRIQKANAGERRAVWTDVSRAYEGSALVALGLLTQLLVKDAVSTEADLLPDLPPPTGE